MQKKALVVIDIQNDITKNYKDIIENLSRAIDWAVENEIHVVYIKHYNLSAGSRNFKPNTRGSDFIPELNLVSDNIFEKSKGNALTSEGFSDFIRKNEITGFYISGADAIDCIKSTVYNMCKSNLRVTVLQDCITSYDKRKMDEMLVYYKKNGSQIIKLIDLVNS